ncbi:unnamed protein product [marine sediment metagenome]|uniref:Uncharacterized protein n=1 Tax=marine sediment metagenome TaxID=412755 RepID=X1BW40_9ZZZZ
MDYTNTTGVFALTYSESSGTLNKGCLKVIKRTSWGDEIVCDECSHTSSATITCTIDQTNGTYIGVFTAGVNPDSYIASIVVEISEGIWDLLGLDGVFFTILLVMVMSCLFIPSAFMSIAGVIITLILATFLGFLPTSWQGIVMFAIAGFIIMFKLRV